jgi:hypothetical protein
MPASQPNGREVLTGGDCGSAGVIDSNATPDFGRIKRSPSELRSNFTILLMAGDNT